MTATYDYFPDGTPKNEFDYNEPLDNNGSFLFYYPDETDDEYPKE